MASPGYFASLRPEFSQGKRTFMLRIAVDARPLSTEVTGIGRYTEQLLARLTEGEDDWLLLSSSPLQERPWLESPNVRVRTAHFKSRAAGMAWAQTGLPYWAGRESVDLLWAPVHRIARYLPKKIARVVTIHDLVWKHAGDTMRPLSRWLDATLMPEAVRLADRIIAVSNQTAQDLVAEFPESKDKIRVIPLGISTLPAPRGRDAVEALGLRDPYILFVGTLEPRKNLQRLIEAYAALPEEQRRGHVLAVAGGRGWGDVDLPGLIGRLGLEGRVHILGYLDETLLSTLYAHAAFLAMPSLYEGFGLPLVEAMSAGRPVLTSMRASMPEVAGPAGVLVDPENLDSLVAGLSRLLDPVEQGSLAAQARRQAGLFSWERAASATRAVFNEALEARRAG